MMKIFEEYNYYEMLKVPANASPEDIKCAYRDALAVYDGDALATYSLFTVDQRDDLLKHIDKAFATLSVRSKRAAYNQVLINTGQATVQDFSLASQKHLASACPGSNGSKAKNLCLWVRNKSMEAKNRAFRDAILAKEIVSGSDLKAFRIAIGVEISDINAITKISTFVLQAIEGNHFESLPAKVYLKRFLQSYANILQIDPQHIVCAYLRNMNGHGNS